ncbi:MAG: glutamyl-tRNA amidotransferase subunit A [Geminicoccaceae bacterium]|jgi:Asp-tRNA(Asn)/Glu-tRNA(Gln) amidotransferase A subunit family amidase|nr:MAG: glutamyl-tRNA amidotransferase subunit A [Geminicoccaceae bacterium]
MAPEPTARALRAALEEGRITVRELIEACLARIEVDEPRLRAWAHLDRDYALAQADALDEARRRGRPTGPLFGLPVGVKDIVDTADLPTEHGSPIFVGRRPARDAWLVERLRAAGAVILGKTVTTEFAAFTPGPTRNPHDPARTPGGSSSGSAAAVAAGMVPLAIGSQTNGSVIRPAAFCGVVGFKPTYGAIPRTGMLEQSPTLDHVGVFARDLADAALLAETLVGFDPEDAATRPQAPPRLVRAAAEGLPVRPRLAILRSPTDDRAEPAMREALAELAESLGDAAVPLELPEAFGRAHAVHRTIWTAELAFRFGRLVAERGELVSDRFRELVRAGERVDAVAYQRALAERRFLQRELAGLFHEIDAFLTPAAPGEAPLGLESTGDPSFCTIWTLCGTPALGLPLFTGPSGLPMGLQLVADLGDDERLFRVAAWLTATLASETMP